MIRSKNIANKCKKKQLSLIKSSSNVCTNINNLCRSLTYDHLNLANIVKNDKTFNATYTIIETKYEKSKKAAYVVVDKKGKKYFLKIRHKELCDENEIKIFNLMVNITHPNILKFIKHLENDMANYFFYEYVDGFTLTHYFVNNLFKTSEQIENILKQSADALKFLHGNKIIHCDIKLDNIMIIDETVKIIDFDLSKICGDKMEYISNSTFGSEKFIAPESFDLGIYTPKSDIWGLGMVFYILITQIFPYYNEPFLSSDDSNLYRRNNFKHINMSILKDKILSNKYDYKIFIIIDGMIKFKDDERFDLDKILQNLK